MSYKERPYYLENEPTTISEFGSGKPELVINVGCHGNETQPVMAVDNFLNSQEDLQVVRGKVRFTISNQPALKANKRFLITDLNRAYPGNIAGEGEEKIAAKMIELIGDADFMVDLHTSQSSPDFLKRVISIVEAPLVLVGEEATMPSLDGEVNFLYSPGLGTLSPRSYPINTLESLGSSLTNFSNPIL